MSARQQSLFESEPAPWEVDDQAEQYVATVVFADGPAGQFDYLVPDSQRHPDQPDVLLEAGKRVQAPFGRGNRKKIGYCLTVDYKPVAGTRLKSVHRVLDPAPLFSTRILELARWMADRYLCSLGQVLEAVVPAGVRQQAGTREAKLLSVSTEVAAQMTQLKLPPRQAEALRTLAASPKPLTAAQLAARVGCTVGPVNSLRRKGLVDECVARIDTKQTGEEAATATTRSLELNPQQSVALESIVSALNSSQHRTLLLHGVTGSGKTEVYMQAIQQVVGFGRQAIVLVPEISLTPQTVARFRSRFPAVAILHSHQSDVERHRQWQRIAKGEVQVVVGARSAVFAPVPNLGLIVIDEEHESSFKQEVAPRYHARDVAQWRAEREQVPLVLGTATPSLESWHRACQGDYQLVEMPDRVMNRPLPAVSTIDLRLEEHSRGSRGALSRPLCQAIEAALREDGQVILLLNRRGFSTHIQCNDCGEVVVCPHCEMSLTFHRQTNSAICHYCDYETAAPSVCPECKSPGIRFSGYGTQKLEAEVRSRFPDYPCVRMDTDTMRKPGSHQQALDSFREGNSRILLGTQMIAKGLDFPGVTLVGVVNADVALHFPDFRAAERTFQLVTQVAGRTGRGVQGGRVIVQTFSPDHPAIVAATRHDFAALAAHELPIREFGGYPPFADMVRVVLRGENESTTQITAEAFADQVEISAQDCGADLKMLGPAPAPIVKLRDQYRYHMQLQMADGQVLREIVKQASERVQIPDSVFSTIDVDPIDML